MYGCPTLVGTPTLETLTTVQRLLAIRLLLAVNHEFKTRTSFPPCPRASGGRFMSLKAQEATHEVQATFTGSMAFQTLRNAVASSDLSTKIAQKRPKFFREAADLFKTKGLG